MPGLDSPLAPSAAVWPFHAPPRRVRRRIAGRFLSAGLSLITGLSLIAGIVPGMSLSVMADELNSAERDASVPFASSVNSENPAFWWDFESDSMLPRAGMLPAPTRQGTPRIHASGPSSPEFPGFPASNPALLLDGRSWLTFEDSGPHSELDFAAGDSISIEAWVRPTSIEEGQQTYIVGKGRTGNPGYHHENQNYALRLRGIGGLAHPSFLFRSADAAVTATDDAAESSASAETASHGEFHRWNSELGFEPDGLWHHVAVTFDFGSDRAPVAWVDGIRSSGSWDMGGSTAARAPIEDNDQLWLGSSMGGIRAATFSGGLDEVLIWRRTLTDNEVQHRFRTTRPAAALVEIPSDKFSHDVVACDLRENVSPEDPWSREGTRITMIWEQSIAGLTALPRKYTPDGLIGDRTNPSVLRLRLWLSTGSGSTQFLIRARSHARLLIDGVEVGQLRQAAYASDGHEEVPEPPAPLYASMHPVPSGDQEAVIPLELTAGEHLVELEALVGGRNMRVETGETLLAMGSVTDGFRLLAPAGATVSLSESDWSQFAADSVVRLRQLERAERQRQRQAIDAYWNRRHAVARQVLSEGGQSDEPLTSAEIDERLLQTMRGQRLEPLPVVNDLTFLRRLTLNTVGVIPNRPEIDWFLSRPESTRRTDAIDRFLADDRWADHWVPYWQDVLAENPGILKPELNNSGPFRWWIHESFLDNKPMDQFATELIMMKGSRLGGGPAGFGMATQNDVPLAERALVVSAAFNARTMTCARCHDSPVRDYSQKQLFQLAAMLNRGPLSVPETSSVPRGPDGERSAHVTVSIEPGTVVEAEWPFPEEQLDAMWLGQLRNPLDLREQAALHVTHPLHSEFADVIVNRLWGRLFGRGLIENQADWSDRETTHAELLRALALEHVRLGYDLKQTARLILRTEAWQRQTAPADSPLAATFAAQSERRLTAEQMVDSLYRAAGKPMNAEMLTLDPEGRRPESTFLNLGRPDRAWQFCSLSNERDRPALALPVAQSVIDLLSVYGWRESRPNSLTVREDAATVLQPLTLSNGNAGHRLIQLNDGAPVTELCLQADSAEALVRDLFRTVLTRDPTEAECALLAEELQEGFASRRVAGATFRMPTSRRNAVSWSNHLNSEATRIKQLLEDDARRGDVPTERLQNDWREAAEDVLWALLNHPEFAFMP